MLVTKPLNTTDADFVQFKFRFGCAGAPPHHRDEDVMVDFTRNGGITWLKLAEIYYSDHNHAPG